MRVDCVAGSMVPFAFRIMHAELPQYLGKTQESLDRLYYIYAIVQKVRATFQWCTANHLSSVFLTP